MTLVESVLTVTAVCFDQTYRGLAFGVQESKLDDWAEPYFWQEAWTEAALLEDFRDQRNSVVAATDRPGQPRLFFSAAGLCHQNLSIEPL
jgi:hypothetical protein